MTKTAILDPEDEPDRNSYSSCPSCGLFLLESDHTCLNCGESRPGEDLKFDLPADLTLPSHGTVTTTTSSANWTGTSGNGHGASVANIAYDCSVEGHLITEYSVESVEGQVTGYCEHCGDRFTMRRFPGGITAVRVKTLIEAVTDEEWANPEAILLEYDYLSGALKEDVTSVRECLGLMNIARLMINEKLGPK